MKKVILLSSFALALMACSNENLTQGEDRSPESEGKATGYMNVKILTPGGINATRADYPGSYVEGPGSYLDGTSEENQVNLVRFYFFDDEDQAVPVRKNPHVTNSDAYYSFIDWSPLGDTQYGGPEHSETVEKSVTATLVLSQPLEGDNPTQVLAVVNPPTVVLNEINNPNLAELQAIITNFQNDLLDENASLTNSDFVMSNSVYAQNGSVVYTTSIPEGTIVTAAEDLEDAIPVNIFVERIVARVEFGISAPAQNNGSYDTGVNFIPTPVNGLGEELAEEIYVNILGWSLVSFPDKSRLIKDINPSWNVDLFNNTADPWNADNYHRSFWALNPPASELTYTWYSYDQIAGTGTNLNPAVPQTGNPMNVTKVYTQENANPMTADVQAIFDEENGTYNPNDGYYPLKPTQIVFTGQLVNAANQPVTVCEFRGKKYTKTGLLNLVASLLDMWTPNGQNGYRHIGAGDLTFMTQTQFLENEAPDMDDPGRYYVYFNVEETTPATPWYQQPTPNNYEPITDTKQYIYESLGYTKTKVWENGMNYYFFNIRHLGLTGSIAFDGIVRNHIYVADVDVLGGLGTPVYDPSEVIYPEYPEGSPENLDVKISILSWRLVPQKYEISW